MEAIGVMAMPSDFKYLDAFLKGRPRHERLDPFAIRHPRMDLGKRAKIFAPFAALKGFDEEVASKEVAYTPKIELGCEELSELNRRLDILHNLTYNGRMARENQVKVSVTFFVPCADTHHEAYGVLGQYQTVTGICRQVDADISRTIRVGNTLIAFENIRRIESSMPIFKQSAYQDEIYAGRNENEPF